MSASLAGELALWIALLLAGWGTTLSTIARPLGRPDVALSGERAAHAATFFVALALTALWIALLRTDLSLQYVVARGGLVARPIERVIALWSAPAGALLVLALAIGVVTSAAVMLARRPARGENAFRSPLGLSSAAAVAQLALVGVLLTLLIGAEPFAATRWPVADGSGLPPAWRHIAMLLAWPLWSGAVGAAAAASMLALAAAVDATESSETPVLRLANVGNGDVLWRQSERWIGAAWLLASAAVLLALWWAYRTMPSVVGWMSRALDVGTVIAWVVLTAVSRRAIRRVANVSARMLALALPLPMLMAISLLRPADGWDPLHELAHGVGGVWWIVTLAALAQVLSWVAVRSRGRALPSREAPPTPGAALGGRLVIVGSVLAAVGLLATALRRDASLVTAPGEPRVVTDVFGGEWRIAYQGLSVRETRDASGAPRSREVLHPFAVRMDDHESLVIARLREYVDVLGRPVAPPRLFPGIRHGLAQDVIALPDSIGTGDEAHVTVSFLPLPGLIWLGGVVLLVGGVLAARADGRRRP